MPHELVSLAQRRNVKAFRRPTPWSIYGSAPLCLASRASYEYFWPAMVAAYITQRLSTSAGQKFSNSCPQFLFQKQILYEISAHGMFRGADAPRMWTRIAIAAINC